MTSSDRPPVPGFERRVLPRTPVERAVRVQVAGRPVFMAMTANVSRGGFFVKMRDPPPVGTRVKFVLDLGQRAIRGHADAAWIRLRSSLDEGPRGMGLRIIFLLDDGARHFEQFVAEAEAQTGR